MSAFTAAFTTGDLTSMRSMIVDFEVEPLRTAGGGDNDLQILTQKKEL